MKKIQIKSLLIISIIFYSNHSFSQFDDRFYYPSKERKSIDSLKYESHFIKIESDSLNCLFIYPKEKAKATVFYFHGAGGNVSNYIQFICVISDVYIYCSQFYPSNSFQTTSSLFK